MEELISHHVICLATMLIKARYASFIVSRESTISVCQSGLVMVRNNRKIKTTTIIAMGLPIT